MLGQHQYGLPGLWWQPLLPWAFAPLGGWVGPGGQHSLVVSSNQGHLILHFLHPFLRSRWQVNEGSSTCLLTVVIGSISPSTAWIWRLALGSAVCVYRASPLKDLRSLDTAQPPQSPTLVIHVTVQHVFHSSLLRGEDVRKKIQGLKEGGRRVACRLSLLSSHTLQKGWPSFMSFGTPLRLRVWFLEDDLSF